MDNVLVERLWGSVKYEEVYLHAYDTPATARARLDRYFCFYTQQMPDFGFSIPDDLEIFRQQRA
jgi:hypothetical protein